MPIVEYVASSKLPKVKLNEIKANAEIPLQIEYQSSEEYKDSLYPRNYIPLLPQILEPEQKKIKKTAHGVDIIKNLVGNFIEIYNTQEKFTYDLDSVHDSSNAAYINPLLDYRVDVGFNQDNDVGWVRIVQSDLVGKLDLPTVQNTISSYNDLQSKFKLQKNLIEDQYALYQKHR